MKSIHVFILLSLFSFQLEAKGGVSLNEAVNQAKSEGRVLSAKTIRGKHEIKVLTPNGTVKIINKQASRDYSEPNVNIGNHRDPQTNHNKYKNSDLPSRSKTGRNQLKLKEAKSRSRSNREGDNNRNQPDGRRSRDNGNPPRNKDNYN